MTRDASSILPGLDLGEIENVVDQREQVAAGAHHALQRLHLSSRLRSRASSSSISVTPMIAFSGVRSSCDMLARNCDLCWLAASSCSALFLDLLEQPRVLDGEHRLGREGLEQRHHRLRELARLAAPDDQRADDLVLAQERDREQRADTLAHAEDRRNREPVASSMSGICTGTAPQRTGRPPFPRPESGIHAEPRPWRRSTPKFARGTKTPLGLVEFVDRARVWLARAAPRGSRW